MTDIRPKHLVTWLDAGREPQNPPNPKYPKGMDVDFTQGARPWCKVKLKYPAPRCGSYLIQCRECDLSVLITTAGRVDDPRSIKLACLVEVH